MHEIRLLRFLFFQFHIFIVLIEKICLCYLSSLYKILYVLFKGVPWSMSNICPSITHTHHSTRGRGGGENNEFAFVIHCHRKNIL